MFIWTGPIHTGFALVFFVIGLAFMIYSFTWVMRGGSDDLEDPPVRKRSTGRSPPSPRPDDWECINNKCRARNQAHARFCRKCGRQTTGR